MLGTRQLSALNASTSRRSVPVSRRCQHARVQPPRAHKAAEVYATEISQAESSGDWLTAFELLTEAKVLKVQLSSASVESGVRTLAEGGQWQRSVSMLEELCKSGQEPSPETTSMVFAALAKAQQGDKAADLLQMMSAAGASLASLSPAYNTLVRTLARQGQLERAMSMLNYMVVSEDIRCDAQSFSCLANAFLKSGDFDQAEEVLEMRDYL